MPIPKTIYQTWKTKQLHPNVQQVRNHIQRLNPEYTMVLFDDDEMDMFIKQHFNADIYTCYTRLNIGAAKADFWRYCILYIHGGIYLDIDSEIVKPLSELMNGDEQCIITREGNQGVFNNWIMMFEPLHPILLTTIQHCCHNITKKTSKDVCHVTGPVAFTKAINEVMMPLFHSHSYSQNLYFEKDETLNTILNNPKNSIRCRIYGIDMKPFAHWKHNYCDDLYRGHVYWRHETLTL